MNEQFNEILPDIVNAITHNFTQSDLLLGKSEKQLPVRSVIIEILDVLKSSCFLAISAQNMWTITMQHIIQGKCCPISITN